MWIQLSSLSGFLLSAENWIFLTVSLKERLDLVNLFTRKMLLLSPWLKLENKTKVILTIWLLLSELVSIRMINSEKKSVDSREVLNHRINLIEFRKKKKERLFLRTNDHILHVLIVFIQFYHNIINTSSSMLKLFILSHVTNNNKQIQRV